MNEPAMSVESREASPVAARASTRPESAARPPRSLRLVWLVAAVAVIGGIAAAAWGERHYGLINRLSKGAEATSSNGGKAALGFASAASVPAASGAPRVETVRVEMVPRRDVLHLTGTLTADERSSVASNTSGIVAEVRVDRGSFVRKNDVLVQLDATDAKNRLAEGQAMLDELKARLGLDENMESFNPEDEPEVRLAKAAADLTAANLRRNKELFDKGVVMAEAFDQAKTEDELATQRYRQARFQIRQAYQACKTAQIKLQILQKAVDDTTIRAPYDGWVAERLVSVGEQVSAGVQATKVVTLVRIDPLRLSLVVPQQDIGRVKLGQTVRFRVDSYPDREFTGTVRYVGPVVTNDTRSMVVEAVTPNGEGALLPGLFATADVELSGQEAGLLVPATAVERAGEVAKVLVVRDGVARETVVALGEESGGKVVIREGLTGNETLVARAAAVRDGDKVSP